MAEHRYIDLAQPQAACDALTGAAQIGVDTEFMREKTYYAQLCLVQFSIGEELWCADPLAAENLDAFWDAILAPDWVLHSGRQDFEVVIQSSGRLPAGVFDTQVAAALLGHAPQMGYANLVNELFDVQLEKSHTRADWSRRPLSAAELRYAAEDVAWLLPACEELTKRLDAVGRLGWAEQDSAELLDRSLYEMAPGTAVDRVKGARNLQGRARRAAVRLADWRERRAEHSDKPRQWILRDAVLLDIAINNPSTVAALGRINNIQSGVVRHSGDDLLAILREAEQADDEHYVAPVRPDDAQKALLKALQKKVAARAKELGIAAEVLAPRRELSAAIDGNRQLRVLRGWRQELVGDDLLELLGG
ncbi:MAG: ribonuclease D [Woeseia sp.]|nr:ribonuclease D [Woeseia sp.]MBT8095590.1 ribonuclease D [Woeseia sp.]NNE61240.1 ribonuclease D [Woeseia sp.]NNL53587.1 ribonuclease D [Woeseia sp.]